MMSNKWTFSLTSLITIIALLSLASMPVFAQDFDMKFDAHDISFAKDVATGSPNGNAVQIERPTGDATSVTVVAYIHFAEVVTLAEVHKAFGFATAGQGNPASTKEANSIDSVDILNSHGAVLDVTGNTFTITNRVFDSRLTTAPNRIARGKDYTITVTLISSGNNAQVAADAQGSFDTNNHAHRLRLHMDEGAVNDADPNSEKKNKKANLTIDLLSAEPGATIAARAPAPVIIGFAPGVLIPASGFTGDTFDIIVTLSEQPKENKLTAADHFDVAEGTASDGVYLGPIEPIDSPLDSDTNAEPATGRDGMHHQYLVTITPAAKDADLVFKLKTFGDQEIYTYNADRSAITGLGPNEWEPPVSDLDRVEGEDKLTVKIKKKVTPDLMAGLKVEIPKEKRIPANGYLVITEDNDGSGIDIPPGSDKKDEPKATERTPRQMLYNVIKLDALPNLEQFLFQGGTIDLVGPAGVYISEIMWGTDASLEPNTKSQWIEITNTGASIETKDKEYKLVFYAQNETLPPVSTVADRVGTVGAGGYWTVTGIGQSGRSGTGEKAASVVAVVPTQDLISMQRQIDAAGTPADGTLKSSWMPSVPPGLNFSPTAVGTRIATPGAAAQMQPTAPPVDPPPADPTPAAVLGDLIITEIMVDTGNDRLPQWIEIANFSGKEVTLDGWSVEIKNSADDADVARKVSIDLTGQTLDVREGANGTRGEALLLVAWGGRSSTNLSDRVLNVSSQLKKTGRYTLISPMGFLIELLPPLATGIVVPSDEVGNLDAAWDIEMDETGRSSLIRVFDAGVAEMGTDADGWTLASSTSLLQTPASWYGSDEDAGTPGVIGGGPLPVELSHFRPARDKATGQVVITWATQSELNNAGFFIKRAQQRDGEFKVVNPTMIPGAGTTSEKQFYTYTDTTAQPNIVYYYQIEDVSLDGNRQTLTNGIRLKGHIGAAGKLTSTWGELKSSNE